MYPTVVLSARNAGIRGGLTYETDTPLKPGTLVRVPFRKRIVEGLVTDVRTSRDETSYALRRIERIFGDTPLLTEAQMQTVQWMADKYMTSPRHILSVWLPAPPWSQLLPKDVPGYRLVRRKEVRGTKQRAIVDELSKIPWASAAELRRTAGATAATLRALQERGMIELEPRREETSAHAVIRHAEYVRDLPELPAAQHAVLREIETEKKPSLLFGGAAETRHALELHLIADTIRSGKQAILLVPEIILTEPFLENVSRVIDTRIVSVLHSSLPPRVRRAAWKRIERGEVGLVIGSRSALFAPLKNLGIIIIDEEHEATYKSEQTPRYHARETAEALSRFSHAKFVLASGTPSLEAWSRVRSGMYHLARIQARATTHRLPRVRVIDLALIEFGTLYPFTAPLLEAIDERLRRKEQSVLFLNRRGVASAVICLECRRRLVSPESSLPYTLHETSDSRPVLLDHTTGARAAVPAKCPSCGSPRLRPVGAGTQRAQQILRQTFPTARILRVDRDVLERPAQTGLVDIILGTAPVMKLIDAPNVTLVAVLVADVGLSLPHFRAGEHTWQLLSRITGPRSRKDPGEVIIQTFRPDAPEIALAAAQKTEEYLDRELQERMRAGYPPSTSMIHLIFRGTDAAWHAKELCTLLRSRATANAPDTKVVCAPALFDPKEWHILLRGSSPRKALDIDLTGVIIDVDPVEIL